jgi:tripartite-type tricarboxylate transporter receptor subunit TctC
MGKTYQSNRYCFGLMLYVDYFLSYLLTLHRSSNMNTTMLRASVLLLSVMSGLSAMAQTPAWPNKPVKIINNFPAGGPSDIMARAIAEKLQTNSGQAVVVDNKPGAGGNIGAAEVAKSAGDGTIIFSGIDTAFTVNPHIFPNIPFKLGSKKGDLKPLVIVSSNGLLLGTSSAKGIRSMGELIAQGKGGGVNFSSGGAGSPGHLGVALFSQAGALKITHVPYRGNSPAVLAIVSGEVDGGILSVSGMLPHVKSGKIVPVAVTSQQRSKSLPDVPTVKELGYPELENEVITVLMVPGDTPETLMTAMKKAVLDVLAQPALRERLATLDMVYEGLTDAAATKRLTDLSTRYAKIVKATHMKVE